MGMGNADDSKLFPARCKTLQEILVLTKRLQTSERILVAVDGRGGAGKSTFARSLVSAFEGASLIEFDCFHLPKNESNGGNRYDFQRFKAEVVNPFREGATSLAIQKYNWGFLLGIEDGFELQPLVVPVQKLLVVEGCQTFHKDIANEYDLRIWMDTDATESLRRGKRRDIEEYGLDPVKVEVLWNEWGIWEEERILRERPEEVADVLYLPSEQVVQSHEHTKIYDWTIVPAQIEHLPYLQTIESAAAQLFSSVDLPDEMRSQTTEYATLLAAQKANLLWVCLDSKQKPIGFLLASIIDGNFHIKEMDVHPSHSRQGIGQAFIKHALSIALQRNFLCMTLTTFSHIPWNAPFYLKNGFSQMEQEMIGNELSDILKKEAQAGLRNRVALVQKLKSM